MDAYDCVATKLDRREFRKEKVPSDVKLKVLEAARLTASGMNTQHWRFILVQDRDDLRRLAQDSTTGRWVEGADFAVIVLTDAKYGFHLLDAGRAIQDMGIAAWNFGIVSCIFTGFDVEALRKHFAIPNEVTPSVIIGFGYPKKKITGKRKRRNPLSEIVFVEKFGNKFEEIKLA